MNELSPRVDHGGEVLHLGPFNPVCTDELAANVLEMAQASSTSANTRRAYAKDLKYFFAALDVEPTPSALKSLCRFSTSQMTTCLTNYKIHMRGLGLASSTINRRLSAVRSLLTLARRFGLTEVDPAGLVDNEKVKRVRNTRGPKLEEVATMLQSPDLSTLEGLRDRTLMRMLWENALRREEISQLNIEDLDLKNRQMRVKRKGGDIVTVEITTRMVKVIDKYLEVRSGGRRLDNGEPIFINLTTNRRGRLTGNGIRDVMVRYSRRLLGRDVSPHKWRHAAATEHQKAVGDIRKTQRLLGHSSSRTTEIYLDDDELFEQGRASEVNSKLA